MRIGIDVGGTNTDAVLMRGRQVLAGVKTPTTPDVTSGIVAALRRLVSDSRLEPAEVQGVMIGTTHFTNAVVEAKRLMPTAAVRLGLPATQALPPMVDWPERLKRAIGGHAYLCHGGHEFDGRLISPLDPEELRRVAADISEKGIRTVAISSSSHPSTRNWKSAQRRSCRRKFPASPSASRMRSAGSGCWNARTRRSSTPACATWRPGSSRPSTLPSPRSASSRRST